MAQEYEKLQNLSIKQKTLLFEQDDLQLDTKNDVVSKYNEELKQGIDIGETSFTIMGLHVSFATNVVSMYGKIGGGDWSYVYSQGGAGNGVFFTGKSIELSVLLAQGMAYLVKYYKNWVNDVDEKLKSKNFQ